MDSVASSFVAILCLASFSANSLSLLYSFLVQVCELALYFVNGDLCWPTASIFEII